MLSENTKKAIHDLRYLLNQGYPRDSAVEFVSNHYLLELEERHLLTRCVFSKEEIEYHRDKRINISEAENRIIGLDGYNVLITVEGILNGGKVIRCDDGFIRDLQAIFGKYDMTESTDKALIKTLKVLKKIKPEEVYLFFDKQVSRSGELAGFARRQLDKIGLRGDAQTVAGVDAKVWDYPISASSDRVIIKKSRNTIDLPAELTKEKNTNLVDLTKI